MEDNKEIKVEEKKEVKSNVKEVKCKVLCSTLEESMVEINGYGLTVPFTIEEEVTIKYVGTIGNRDFRIVE